ncbi:hypothetical protein [Ekhidna sp.]|uniref:hypothetical protein n=1 Tax=Ekhidna sp. TaxID=2608089 RepID=UPI003B5A7DF0
MKKTFILIIGILIGVVACYFYLKPSDDSSKENFLGLTPPTKEQIALVDTLEAQLRRDRRVSRGLGTRISKIEAERHINDFKSIKLALKPAMQSLDLSMSTSYSFGLDEIKQLVNDIDSLNRYRTSADSLTGIRIHLGKSSREINRKTVFYVDAFITPVDKEGDHIFKDSRIVYQDIPDRNLKSEVSAQKDGTVSLNNSNPCPDVCESGS